MKKYIIGALAVTAALFAGDAYAVKAKPGVIDYVQQDGSILKIKLHGDEKFHYATTPDDFLILPNGNGIYEYAVTGAEGEPVLSGIKASTPSNAVSRQLIKGISYAKSAHALEIKENMRKSRTRQASGSGQPKYRYSTSVIPTTGNLHSLVILVEYPDYGFNMDDPYEYFNDFLNGENFMRDGASGSCKQFYTESSNGAFVPTFDLYGPVLLKNNRRYYGAGYEYNAHEMVIEAVEALDDEVDFSQYDHNDDGLVDSIYIIYSDKGEADGGPRESVWPYSYELLEEGVTLTADGVTFNTYGMSNALQSDNQNEGIGTFTHEFGHVLGLPDLYNTDNSLDFTTPDKWSLMDSGSYNNDSRTPPCLSSFERYSLGWLTPEEILTTGEYSLDPLKESNHAYILTSEEKEDEFFLLEYRTQSGWDSYLPGQGMLVWHIDFVQSQWDWNTVNNNIAHQYVDLVRADNIKSEGTFSSDPFPGTMKVTSFGKSTSPALKSWLSKELNVTEISNIREEGGKIMMTASVTEERHPNQSGVTYIDSDSTIRVDNNFIITDSGSYPVYDIAGRKVGVVSEGSPLYMQSGLYIVNRQKLHIK